MKLLLVYLVFVFWLFDIIGLRLRKLVMFWFGMLIVCSMWFMFGRV